VAQAAENSRQPSCLQQTKATCVDADTQGYGKVQGLRSCPWELPTQASPFSTALSLPD